MQRTLAHTVFGLLALCAAQAAAAEPSQEELERWFLSDDPQVPGVSTAHVNDGELEFLSRAPDKPVHHHRNALTISRQSLDDGWVRLSQCHRNLDRVSRAEILFGQGRVRDLRIHSSRNIGAAWVEGHSVQLQNVASDAELCVEAWTRALRANGDGTYSLRNGPFMRKFLDGYYPMRVSLDVDYADSGLDLLSVSPYEQDGFEVSRLPKRVQLDALFEGRLQTELLFGR